MIGTSKSEYVFIRVCIFSLRAITPLSVSLVLSELLAPRLFLDRAVWVYLTPWAVLETLFYSLVYLPMRHRLQRERRQFSDLPSHKRRSLFQKCLETITDVETYLRKWFLDAPLEDIRKKNVKEFLAWSLFNKKPADIDQDEDDELDDYVFMVEDKLNHELEGGKGPAKSLRLAFDEVLIWHRPLLWYTTIGLVEVRTHLRLLYNGWNYYRHPLSRVFNVFPPPLCAALSRSRTPAETLTYWHRKGSGSSFLPVLFIHGIGIGLHPYVDFLNNLAQGFGGGDTPDGPDIIAIEIMPICARICRGISPTEQICNEIDRILNKHQWTNFAVVGHSFGTAIAAALCKRREYQERIKQLVVVDPICFLLHLPDVAFNFTRRVPVKANEYLLHYFSSTDMMISETLARRFFWTEFILWTEDISHVPTFVTLADRDLVINTDAVWDYLIDNSAVEEQSEIAISGSSRSSRFIAQRGKIEVWRFAELDHAQVFDYRSSSNDVVLKIRQLIGQAS